MVVGVEAFVRWVSIESWPSPTCPTCEHGVLLGKDDLLKPESGVSKSWRREEGWEPDWIYGSLAGILTCNNSECGEVTSVAGSWRVGDSRSPYEQYDTQLSVRYFDPPLRMIHLPKDTPDDTAQSVRDASHLLLVNPSAAANRLRQGIEALMDAEKVKKTTYAVTKGGKRTRVRISLHDRIVAFRAKHGDVAHLLEAVKWIGNDGSHESGLSAGEVLIGANILEVALRRLYETHNPALDRQVAEIIRRKGIRKR